MKIIICASRDIPCREYYIALVGKRQTEQYSSGQKVAFGLAETPPKKEAHEQVKQLIFPSGKNPFNKLTDSDGRNNSVEFIAHGFDNHDIGNIAVLKGDGYTHPESGVKLTYDKNSADGKEIQGKRIRDSNGKFLDAGPWIDFTPSEISQFFKENAHDGHNYKFTEITLYCCNSEKFARELSQEMPDIIIRYFNTPINLDENGVVRIEQTKEQEAQNIPGDEAKLLGCICIGKAMAKEEAIVLAKQMPNTTIYYLNSDNRNELAACRYTPKTENNSSNSSNISSTSNSSDMLGFRATTLLSSAAMPISQKESSFLDKAAAFFTNLISKPEPKSEASSIELATIPKFQPPLPPAPCFIAPYPNAHSQKTAIKAYIENTKTPTMEDHASEAPRLSGPGSR